MQREVTLDEVKIKSEEELMPSRDFKLEVK